MKNLKNLHFIIMGLILIVSCSEVEGIEPVDNNSDILEIQTPEKLIVLLIPELRIFTTIQKLFRFLLLDKLFTDRMLIIKEINHHILIMEMEQLLIT